MILTRKSADKYLKKALERYLDTVVTGVLTNLPVNDQAGHTVDAKVDFAVKQLMTAFHNVKAVYAKMGAALDEEFK